MPTFTTIALENLLEPRNSARNSPSTLKNPQPPKSDEEENDEATREKNPQPRQPLNHIYISPALYATPQPTRILDYSTPGSLSPSPYVFNRKGRGGGKFSDRRVDGFEIQESGDQSGENGDEILQFPGGAETENCLGVEGQGQSLGEDEDDFLDPPSDLLSVASSNDCAKSGVEVMSLVSNQFGEFYDATEDFSSEGSISNTASCSRDVESELCATRLSLLEEIEKRKTAEDAIAMLCTQWQRMGKLLLSQTGLTFPMQLDISAMEQLFQEIIVVQFVAEAIGKGEARTEAEVAAAAIIESKDQEIARLRDKMQYYEAMIHEMSQKNLESMEGARRERNRKKGQRKWLWSCIGMSIVIGASVIAYSYAPQSSSDSDPQPEVGGN